MKKIGIKDNLLECVCKRQCSISYWLIILMNILCIDSFAFDIEVMNNDGVIIYYNYVIVKK